MLDDPEDAGERKLSLVFLGKSFRLLHNFLRKKITLHKN